MRKTSEFIKIRDCIGTIARNVEDDDFDFEKALRKHEVEIEMSHLGTR